MSREPITAGATSRIAPAASSRTRPALRVALVVYRDSAGCGGAYRVAETLGAHLGAAGVDPHLVFAYGEPGPVGQSAGFSCHYLRATGPKDLPAWRRARKFFRDLNPNIIHFVEPVIWLNAALLGIGARKIWYSHGKLFPQYMRWLDLRLLHLVSRVNDGCVSISEGARNNLVALGLAGPDACWTVYNSIDTERFAHLPGRPQARASLGLAPDVKVLGMVCRLIEDKGCADALELLCRLDPGWHLMLAGEGPYRRELERLAQSKGLQERVHFTGPLHDVRPAYAAMDAYLFLTRYEPFGLVLAEAMAAGVPIFGLGSMGEYREPQYPLLRPDTAVLVERSHPEDIHAIESPAVLDELAERLLHFGDHPELYRAMTDRARQWVRERFDAPRQAQSMAAVYRHLVEG